MNTRFNVGDIVWWVNKEKTSVKSGKVNLIQIGEKPIYELVIDGTVEWYPEEQLYASEEEAKKVMEGADKIEYLKSLVGQMIYWVATASGERAKVVEKGVLVKVTDAGFCDILEVRSENGEVRRIVLAYTRGFYLDEATAVLSAAARTAEENTGPISEDFKHISADIKTVLDAKLRKEESIIKEAMERKKTDSVLISLFGNLGIATPEAYKTT